MVYFDSAYIVKCYLREDGTDAVLDLAEASAGRASLVLAAVEVQAAFHRHWREGRLDETALAASIRRFEKDQADGYWHWIPASDDLMVRAASRFRSLPRDPYVRSADCLHLCAAREAGFDEIFSSDRHLLSAAAHFGLRGIDVIAASR